MGDAVYLEALQAIDRDACAKWVQAQGAPISDEAWKDQEATWRSLPLLGSTELQKLTLEALVSAQGPTVSGDTPLHLTLWRGRFDVENGRHCDTTLYAFADWLESKGHLVVDKGAGWVACPTVNRDGKRVNGSTMAMTALNLDNDGRGSWDKLLAVLDRIGTAYIVYQSGGWSPDAQKWHLLVPLAQPFDTSSAEKIVAWKRGYNACRVVFGALAELTGEGFDPTTETPSVPVFVTERRKEEDPPRKVIFHPGHSLDFETLSVSLPIPPEEEHSSREHASVIIVEALSDEKLEAIVQTLCEPMSKILSGRRDLYLSLPGALLDRGLEPDDVREIVEEISLRCPGDPDYTDAEVASKHREHLHCTETTISKYERGERYLRIGTIVENWLPVARAIDAAIPNPENVSILARFEAPTSVVGTNTEIPAATFDPIDFRKSLRTLVSKKKRAADFHNRVRGVVLGALLDGEDLIPRVGGEPVEDSNGEPYSRESALETVVRMMAFKFPIGFKAKSLFDTAIREFLRPSVKVMLDAGETDNKLMALAKQTFEQALVSRIKREDRDRKERLAFADRLDRALQTED